MSRNSNNNPDNWGEPGKWGEDPSEIEFIEGDDDDDD
jgi:hypothetical protein